jgi:hypothetical protein
MTEAGWRSRARLAVTGPQHPLAATPAPFVINSPLFVRPRLPRVNRVGDSHITISGYRLVVGRNQREETSMKWEAPEYAIIEVCAEATGYFYRG